MLRRKNRIMTEMKHRTMSRMKVIRKILIIFPRIRWGITRSHGLLQYIMWMTKPLK